MTDIVEFLTAQYDRIEKAARAAQPGPWSMDENQRIYADDDGYVTSPWTSDERDEDLDHVVLNDPAYVLADIESKRQIVARHSDSRGGDPSCSSLDYPENAEDCETLRLLAAPFSGEPGYKEEWSV